MYNEEKNNGGDTTKQYVLPLILSFLMILTACNGQNAPPDNSSQPAPSTEQPTESQPAEETPPVEDEAYAEPVYVDDVQLLYGLAEYQEAAAVGANITAYFLPEAEINATELLALLEAVENGGDAVFEVYFFSNYDYFYQKLEVTGGSCTSTGWEKSYGSDSLRQEWSNHDIGHVELMSNGMLFLQNGRQALPVYTGDLPVEHVQAYHTYLAALEFNGLEHSWQSPDYGVRWNFYFEDAYRIEHGTMNIWADYPDGHFPAEVYEGIIQQHFSISTEQLRLQRNYEANTNTYFYEGGRGGAYIVRTRVLNVDETDDGRTAVRYTFYELAEDSSYNIDYVVETVDGVQRIKRIEEEYLLTVENTGDGFMYLSNQAL